MLYDYDCCLGMKLMGRQKLSLSVIGGGINSAVGRAHLSSLQLSGKWKFQSALFSRNPEINVKTAELWGVPKVHNDIESLILESANNTDVFLLLTPTPTHFEILDLLSKVGKPVICEKSLTHSSESAQHVMRTFQRNKLFTTFNYTGYPMVRELRSRIHQNHYGDLIRIEISMPQESFAVNNSQKITSIQEWRKVDGLIPTTALDLGVHVHNLLHFLTDDRINHVVSMIDNFGRLDNILDSFSYMARLRKRKNLQILLNYGKTYLGQKNGLSIKVFGSLGAASWKQIFPDYLQEVDEIGTNYTVDYSSGDLLEANKSRYARFKVGHPTGFIEAFTNIYEDIYDNINQEMEYSSGLIFSPEIAYQGLIEIEAAVRSAKTQQWVEVLRK